MTTWVALLRGINVGKANRISMPALTAAFDDLGLEDPVAYLQSGNVVFGSDEEHGAIQAAVQHRISEVFGIEIAVLLRTEDELAALAAVNPFLDREPERAKLHVVFLDAVPDAAAVDRLDPARSPPDEFAVAGREIYVHYPNGSGRSKLSIDHFERQLGTRATARNWNTVTRLLELARR